MTTTTTTTTAKGDAIVTSTTAETLEGLRAQLEEARELASEAVDAETVAREAVDAATTRRALADTPDARSSWIKAKRELARCQEVRALADARVRALERGVQAGAEEQRTEARTHWQEQAAIERERIAKDEARTRKLLGDVLEALEVERARLVERASEIKRSATAAAVAGVVYPSPARALDEQDWRVLKTLRTQLEYLIQLRTH